MSSQRYYFDEPVVRIDIDRCHFPRICPVCGERGTKITRITIASEKQQYLRRSWDPSYHPLVRRSHRTLYPKTKVLPIYTCENHEFSDDDHVRSRTLCLIIDGFSMAFLLFGLLFIGDAFARGGSISVWSISFIAFFSVSMLFSWIAFRPNSVERAVHIIGFDSGMQNVILEFGNKAYRDAVIQENPMTSELITWIVKPRR